MEEDYNVLEYPEGVERAEEEMLFFLPDIKEVKDAFISDLLYWLVQM